MEKIKMALLKMYLVVRTWLSDLFYETKGLLVLWVHRLLDVVHGLLHAALHAIMIPWHAVQWVGGCLKATWRAISSIWSKPPSA